MFVLKKQLLLQVFTDCIEVNVVEMGEKFSGTTPLLNKLVFSIAGISFSFLCRSINNLKNKSNEEKSIKTKSYLSYVFFANWVVSAN